MTDIPIVDPHHHLWDLEKNLYPWLMETSADSVIGDTRPLSKSYRVEDLKRDMKGLGVIKSVHVAAAMEGPDPVAATGFLATVAREHGRRNGLLWNTGVRDRAVDGRLVGPRRASDSARGLRRCPRRRWRRRRRPPARPAVPPLLHW